MTCRSMSTVQTTISRHMLPLNRPRCFRVCTYRRMRRRSLTASSLDELLDSMVNARVFMMSYQFLTLVLEEDGTVVDSEEFFQSLPNSTPLMVLEKGEMFLPKSKFSEHPKKSGIAKVTFDLYKLQPKDFLCCLAIRATLYETYTLSYDFRFTRIKHILKMPSMVHNRKGH
uniref:CIDE-N domain-containing protein n=1 Tax=Oreochromis aureus TaxID=47969 RepID=A0AAZ1WYB1_OREAU